MGNHIIQLIESNTDNWSWALYAAGSLKQKRDECQNALGPCGVKFMISDLTDMRREYNTETLADLCKTFTDNIERCVTEMTNEVTMLLRMHNARRKKDKEQTTKPRKSRTGNAKA